MAGSSCPDVFRFMTANVTGKTHECLLLLFFPGDAHFVGIDHDHEIAGIDMRGADGFLLSAQESRSFDCDTAKHLIFRVDAPPFAWNFGGFSWERFHHGREKARK